MNEQQHTGSVPLNDREPNSNVGWPPAVQYVRPSVRPQQSHAVRSLTVFRTNSLEVPGSMPARAAHGGRGPAAKPLVFSTGEQGTVA